MMKNVWQISKVWLFGAMIVGAGVFASHGDTNTTYTLSFEDYTVRGTNYSVTAITGLVSGATLPNLDLSTRHDWLLGWADDADTTYYNAYGQPLVKFTAETNVTLHALLDLSMFTHTLSFADYRIGGKTYSIPSMTYLEDETLTNLPETVVFPWNLGWYTGVDGTGARYYDNNGKPVVDRLLSNKKLYPKLDPQYLPSGVSVNGQEIDAAAEEGRGGEGWSYDFASKIVTLSGTTEYFISGEHNNGNVRFRVATNATVVVSNLFLKIPSMPTTSFVRGLFDVAEGAKVDFELQGKNSIDASGAPRVAGIFCPRGSTVKIWCSRKRDLEFESATNMSYHGVLFDREFAAKDLVVRGGLGAAAIGGRSSTDNGLSGRIIVQNCSLWVQGGGDACDVGAGNSSLTTDQINACGMVQFTSHSNVRLPDQGTSKIPQVRPNPHGDWETPVFPRVVTSQRGLEDQTKIYNVFWFPYGTTRVKTTRVAAGQSVYTDEVSFTISHGEQ